MCEWGHEKPVTLCAPRAVSGRFVVPVDACIASIVQALNDAGIETISSCCGHGNAAGEILMADGRSLTVHRLVHVSVDVCGVDDLSGHDRAVIQRHAERLARRAALQQPTESGSGGAATREGTEGRPRRPANAPGD